MSDVVELGYAEPKGVDVCVAVSEVELGVALSDVVELGEAEPEVVKLGVTVSEVVGLGYAKPEVVELGVAVSEVRNSGQMGRSTYPFDRGKLIWARLEPSGWKDGSGSVCGGVWWGVGRRGVRGGGDQEQQQQRGAKIPV